MQPSDTFSPIFAAARRASLALRSLSPSQLSDAILAIADRLESSAGLILEANAADLDRMDPSNPLYDRLQLTGKRISEIAADMRHVAALPSPVGEEIEHRTLPNGIDLRRVRCPFGVVGVIYEARPNVTFDVAALCLRSGNACLLKGGGDAAATNRAAASIIASALAGTGIPAEAVTLLPSTHEATAALLGATGQVDVCIPRGGRRLIDFVRDNARIPVIETGAGVVHAYFDAAGSLAMGRDIIENAKTRRVSVCNALDSLLIHASRLTDLPALMEPLKSKNVILHADALVLGALRGHYPAELLREASEADPDTEWMDYQMGVYTVSSLHEALDFIARHGSGHSETIITDDASAAETFQQMVDAACVYVNLPTSFTDGAQFGLGAEIGISTQKLGPRGPMGLTALTTYRWLLSGNGQIRPR